MKSVALLLILPVIILPTEAASILCFCNSPSCLQAICQTSQRCFTRLARKARQFSADGNVTTSIVYGCMDAWNSSDICSESVHMICCDKHLCNMPNMLRKVTKVFERRSPMYTTHAPPKVNENTELECKCASSLPAMRVASVAAPCALILTVIVLSLALCRKMSRYKKKKNMRIKSYVKKRPSHVIQLGKSMDPGIPKSFSSWSRSCYSHHELVNNSHSV